MMFDKERAPDTHDNGRQQRSTAEGRRFGNVSYASEGQPSSEDLRRPSGAVIRATDAAASPPVRTTSERKSTR